MLIRMSIKCGGRKLCWLQHLVSLEDDDHAWSRGSMVASKHARLVDSHEKN